MPEPLSSETELSSPVSSKEIMTLETNNTVNETVNGNGRTKVNKNGKAKEMRTIKEKVWIFLTNNALLLFTLIGVIVGFSLGFGLRQHDLSDSGLMWLGKMDYQILLLVINPLWLQNIYFHLISKYILASNFIPPSKLIILRELQILSLKISDFISLAYTGGQTSFICKCSDISAYFVLLLC